jgi:hypothetical protein
MWILLEPDGFVWSQTGAPTHELVVALLLDSPLLLTFAAFTVFPEFGVNNHQL